ncbi:MAG TPA: thrombospondin type 3 repeat-containing protein, partial [Niabella sp.]|nr:thrombospondin type 3 repeat-containing protein [Niabella sp.]
GSTLGGENCSFMRNLWADNTGRNPSIGWNGVFNFVNNVVFNWVHRSIDGGDYRAQYNIINNYFKPGPATPKDQNVGHRILKPESGRSKLPYKVYGRAYVNGNIMEGYPEVTKDNWNGGVQIENEPNAGEHTAYMKQNKPLIMPDLTIISADQAKRFVLANVGATLPKRDAVDARIVKQVETGRIDNKPICPLPETQFQHRRLPIDSYKIGIITDPCQAGGYPEYKGMPYKDTDNDGIPDEWERKNGLNPHNSSDASKIAKNGYSNIENYLNSLVRLVTVVPTFVKK